MDSSTLKPWQEISEGGVVHDRGSLYARFEKVGDPRHAHGKRYRLTTLLVIIFMAKLCGKDRPGEIADWAKNHSEELAKLWLLPKPWIR